MQLLTISFPFPRHLKCIVKENLQEHGKIDKEMKVKEFLNRVLPLTESTAPKVYTYSIL